MRESPLEGFLGPLLASDPRRNPIALNTEASKIASHVRQRYRRRKVKARPRRVANPSKIDDEEKRTFLLPQKAHVAMVEVLPFGARIRECGS